MVFGWGWGSADSSASALAVATGGRRGSNSLGDAADASDITGNGVISAVASGRDTELSLGGGASAVILSSSSAPEPKPKPKSQPYSIKQNMQSRLKVSVYTP